MATQSPKAEETMTLEEMAIMLRISLEAMRQIKFKNLVSFPKPVGKTKYCDDLYCKADFIQWKGERRNRFNLSEIIFKTMPHRGMTVKG